MFWECTFLKKMHKSLLSFTYWRISIDVCFSHSVSGKPSSDTDLPYTGTLHQANAGVARTQPADAGSQPGDTGSDDQEEPGTSTYETLHQNSQGAGFSDMEVSESAYQSLTQNRTNDLITYANSQILAPNHAGNVNWSVLDTAMAAFSSVSDERWSAEGRHLEEDRDLPPPVPVRHRGHVDRGSNNFLPCMGHTDICWDLMISGNWKLSARILWVHYRHHCPRTLFMRTLRPNASWSLDLPKVATFSRSWSLIQGK